MTDEIANDAKTALADVKGEIGKLESDETATVGYVKAHIAWLAGLGGFAIGLVLMYLAIKH